MGRVGLAPSEFESLTPREFYYYVQGWNETNQNNAELQRLMTCTFVNTQLKKPISDPKKLIKFGWEHDKVVKLSGDEIEQLKNW